MRALANIRDELWKGGQKHLPKATLDAGGTCEQVVRECAVCQLQNEFSSTVWQQQLNQFLPYAGTYCWCRGGGVRRSCGLHCPNCDAQIATYRSQLQQFARQVGQQVAVKQAQIQLPVFEKTVRFLVTNKLEVFENSSIKALQIIGAHGVDLAAIETVHTRIDADRFKKMLGMLLLNSDAILSILLPKVSGEELATAAGTSS